MGSFANLVWSSRFFVVVALQVCVPFTGIAGARADTGGERAVGELALTTERVVVFKDGYGLFVKAAIGTADAEGRVFTGEVPDAVVLGSFWATVDDGTIRAMRAEWIDEQHERTRSTPCISMLELLRANVGKQLTMGLTDRDAPPLACECRMAIREPGTNTAKLNSSRPTMKKMADIKNQSERRGKI